jgi:hypothetical protein
VAACLYEIPRRAASGGLARFPDTLARRTMLIACPGCQRQLNVPEQSAGQQVRCPLCQVVFQAPAAAPAPVSSPPPAPPPAPPAYDPGPRAPAAPADPYAGRGPDVPGEDVVFEDDRPRGAGGVRTQHLLNRGAVHLMVSAILFAVMAVANLLFALILAGMMPFTPPGYMVGVIFGMFLMLLVLATPIVFLFIGSNLLRRARGRGLVLTACILAIVFAGLCTLGVIGQLISIFRIDRDYHGNTGTALLLMGLRLVIVLAATVYGYIAGISTLTLLARPDVKEAYGLYAPRRGRPRRDYYDDRRERYDDGRERYEEERW